MNAFIETIKAIRAGASVAQASKLMAQVKAACERTGKKGSITMTLTLEPLGNEAFKISFESKANPPKETIGAQILFADGDHFSRQDPNQPELDLKVIEAQTTTIENDNEQRHYNASH